jgi:hypothetical protein
LENRIAIEDENLEQIEKMIRDTPAKVDLTRRIMERYEQDKTAEVRVTPPRRQVWRKAAVAAAAAVLILTAITGTGLISPAAAETLRQIPGMERVFQLAGDLGLQIADEQGLYSDPEASDTHDGMTVAATAVTFDGTRVSVGIEGEAVGSGASLRTESLLEGMNDVQLSIDGQSLNTYAPDGSSIGPFMFPVPDSDKLVLEFSDLRNQGGQAFPQQFNLALSFKVTGITGEFRLNIPVELNTRNNVVITPAGSGNYGSLQLQVDKIELTPVTTNITTRLTLEGMTVSELYSSRDTIGYDVFDDQGHKLQMLSGNGSSATGGSVLIMDTRFEPFAARPQFITIKPYHYVYKENSTNEFQLGEDGHVKVDYIPELEMTVPVPAAAE